MRAARWVAFLAALLMAATSASAETRVALVIGNADYLHGGRLTNPANDAAAVAQTLRKLGFTVTSRGDLGKAQLEDALKKFTRDATGSDVALVYYAGHGMEKGGANYLIPVDATLAADSDVDFETVPLDLVMRSVGGARRLKVVILDACRNNPFRDTMRRSAGTRSIGQGLAPPPDTEEGDMLVAYAAGANSTAEDGGGVNSPFATALVRRLTDPDVDIRIVFGKVRDDVRAATHMRQDPAVYESLSGEQFFLATTGGAATQTARAPAPAAPADSASVEVAYWQSVQASNDPNELKSYLEQYPNGAFAALAKTKMAALVQPATRSAAVVGSGRFDGVWDTTVTCPAAVGALGFSYAFASEVKGDVLHGERERAGEPGSYMLDGQIQPDGQANLFAKGIVAAAAFAAGQRPKGSDYAYHVDAHFDDAKGAGQRVEGRHCELIFTRK